LETRTLGHGGPQVSLVGLGCNNFGGRIDRAATAKVIDKAIDLGINHFDTADIYGGGGKSEELIGELLGDRRKKIVLATKFGKLSEAVAGLRGTRDYIKRAADASLKRLRTDWIDLYYMHEPDPQTPIEETLSALDELTRAGKIRYSATSNFNAAEVTEAVATAKRLGVKGFIASQDEYSLLERDIERELHPTLDANGLDLVPYFPLAAGALTGKYKRGHPMPEGARLSKGGYDRYVTPQNVDKIENLRAFVEKQGHTMLELAFSWLARRPRVVSIIAGATKPDQLEANVRATGWALTPAELAEIDRITA
jgi:aryl-alcohol dehydrogenase-like predicted oxidoreductase